ncbi:hypothetical protein [Colwellia sp. UCD-KL20]|uniref:hypothetical protein n=1 Tax=Colwellia sp. UCD-KL20 TaxID=1917165 RepID=UPI0009714486|nr:hypothetical protein [Colwellia sp. UCD-KL20]
MHWNNFQFCCRYLEQKLSEGDELKSAQDKLIAGYPRYQPKQLQYNPIYKSILKADNQQELLSIYGKLRINQNTESIAKLTNIKSYLVLIFVVFLIMVFISSTYTIPVFQEIFSIMDSPIAEELELVNIYWLFSSVMIIVCGAIVFRFSFLIEQVKVAGNPFQPSLFKRLILTKRIINELENIDALIHSPIDHHINSYSPKENEFYQLIKNDNLNVVLELETLINQTYIKLNKTINSRLSVLLTLVCFSIVFSIYIFLSSLYTPIFATGTII